MDLNQRPLGYEPNELPGCSTPRYKKLMAEKEGFEPPRRRRPPGFQDRSLQPNLGISPHIAFSNSKYILTHIFIKCQHFFDFHLVFRNLYSILY